MSLLDISRVVLSISASCDLPFQYPNLCYAVENEAHCDFVKLREMLIRINMEDLREQTHSRHYELYRRCKLEEMGFKDTDPDSKPFRYLSHQPGPAQLRAHDGGGAAVGKPRPGEFTGEVRHGCPDLEPQG